MSPTASLERSRAEAPPCSLQQSQECRHRSFRIGPADFVRCTSPDEIAEVSGCHSNS
jgi:hypothetical protein